MLSGPERRCRWSAAAKLPIIQETYEPDATVSIVAHRYQRLKETVVVLAEAEEPMQLPDPKTSLKVENITVAAPSSGRILLSDVSFELKPGQALGGIGPSGGGKTTLRVRADGDLAFSSRECEAG